MISGKVDLPEFFYFLKPVSGASYRGIEIILNPVRNEGVNVSIRNEDVACSLIGCMDAQAGAWAFFI